MSWWQRKSLPETGQTWTRKETKKASLSRSEPLTFRQLQSLPLPTKRNKPEMMFTTRSRHDEDCAASGSVDQVQGEEEEEQMGRMGSQGREGRGKGGCLCLRRMISCGFEATLRSLLMLSSSLDILEQLLLQISISTQSNEMYFFCMWSLREEISCLALAVPCLRMYWFTI